MNTVMIIPTGIGCEIGGHAGDATPAAKLLGHVSDHIIVHPNVVNGSDLNEMPPNSLYVEGSMLDRFLEDEFGLRQATAKNRILVVVNEVRPETVNAVSATRANLGADVRIMELKEPLHMTGYVEHGKATGHFSGAAKLISQIAHEDYDALAIATPIEVDKDIALNYFNNGGVNPWGGIEALVTKYIGSKINKPCAHAPVDERNITMEELDVVVDPRMAAEVISQCFLHCVLKGLHRAPRVHWHHYSGPGLRMQDIDVMVSPMCWGRPHVACEKAGIPIIFVRENTTTDKSIEEMPALYVNNYLEAAGLIAAIGAGVDVTSVRRPLPPTEVL